MLEPVTRALRIDCIHGRSVKDTGGCLGDGACARHSSDSRPDICAGGTHKSRSKAGIAPSHLLLHILAGLQSWSGAHSLLAAQQTDALSTGTTLRVRCVLGETDKFWDKDVWDQQLLSHDVLVTTYQVLYNKMNMYLKGTDCDTLVRVQPLVQECCCCCCCWLQIG